MGGVCCLLVVRFGLVYLVWFFRSVGGLSGEFILQGGLVSSLVAWFGGILANEKQMRTWALF